MTDLPPIDGVRAEIEKNLKECKACLANLDFEYAQLSTFQKACYCWLNTPARLFWVFFIKKNERLLKDAIQAEHDLKHSHAKVHWAASNISSDTSDSLDSETKNLSERLDSLDHAIEKALHKKTSENSQPTDPNRGTDPDK
jgi:hypothetical protein